MPSAVIGVNGPPASGKSTYFKWLFKQLSLDTNRRVVSLQISPFIFQCGVDEGYFDTDAKDVHEFKAQNPDNRQSIIEYAEWKRLFDPNCFLRSMVESPTFQEADIVLYDNVGFQHEVEFFERLTDLPFFSVHTILLPFKYGFETGQTQHPRARYPVPLGRKFPGDSRESIYPTQGWFAANSADMIAKTAAVMHLATQEEFDYERDSVVQNNIAWQWRFHVMGITDSIAPDFTSPG